MSDLRIPAGRIREITDLEEVVTFLGDELDWPVDSADLEELTFEYEADELGITAAELGDLKANLRQLRPLTADQPWGIFFIEFSGGRIRLTTIRRILRALVKKKRAVGDGSRKSWNLSDLLFIVTAADGAEIEIHLVTFAEVAGTTQPEIRSISWSPATDTDRRIERIATELLPRLAWPESFAEEEESWRSDWQAAFALKPGESITSAARLADRMAETAHGVRQLIAQALAKENGSGPFSMLLAEIKAELVHDATSEQFADMCAQTIVYGMLTSRITDPEGFGASPALSAVPLSNGFLSSFFEQVHNEATDLDLDGAGLEALVADLRDTQVEAILDDFGSSTHGGDPVIHFYEEFLKRYDNKIKIKTGAFYTPQAVVRFIVRAVDDALRESFGLSDGVADAGTWREVSERIGFDIPPGVEPESQFIAMLDPATGTGTFLVEWVRQARASAGFERDDERWVQRLRSVVLPSINAFELMLAPYSIAHLKLALEAGDEEGLPDSTILLTDTLERSTKAAATLEDHLDPVAAEGQRAERLKAETPITVILGNPPYLRIAKEDGGGWLVHGGGGSDPPIFDGVVAASMSAAKFGDVASLYNLYTYFWVWSMWKVFEQSNGGPGVVAFITASSWLDGPGFIGLRDMALRWADEIQIVDLGGDNRLETSDDNVFDIEIPVAIVLLVRRGDQAASEPTRVLYRRVGGSRSEKLAALEHLDFTETEGADTVVASDAKRVLRPQGGGPGSAGMPFLRDLFPWQQPGSKLDRTWTVSPSDQVLAQRWERFLEDRSHDRRAALFPNPRHGRRITTKVGALERLADLDPGAEHEPIVPYGWRAFDQQRTFRDPRLAKTESPSLWQSVSEDQIFLVAPSTGQASGSQTAFVSVGVPDMAGYRGHSGRRDVIALFRDRAALQPNITPGVMESLSERLSIPIGPSELFAYCYGLLGGGAYTKIAENLMVPELRVPLTADASLWSSTESLGRELIWLHTMGGRDLDGGRDASVLLRPEVRWAEAPTSIPARRADIGWDAANECLRVGNGCLTGVSSDVWEFNVNGWPVVKRWCEARTEEGRGRRSSELDDIRPDSWLPAWTSELSRLVSVLQRTVDLGDSQESLLRMILDGPMLFADDLPEPTDAERAVPETLSQSTDGTLFD